MIALGPMGVALDVLLLGSTPWLSSQGLRFIPDCAGAQNSGFRVLSQAQVFELHSDSTPQVEPMNLW